MVTPSAPCAQFPPSREPSRSAPQWLVLAFLLALLTLAIAGCGNSVSGPGNNNTTATTTTLTAVPADILPTETTVLTATVTNVAGAAFIAPTGNVTFQGNSNITLGNAVLTSTAGAISATASITVSGGALSVGANSITVSYPGDTFHTASVSASTTVTVAAMSNTTATALTASLLSLTAAQTTTLTATVTNGTATGLPTGLVSFTANGSSTPLGSATLASGGNMSTAIANLPVLGSALTSGANTIVANYLGDATHAASAAPSISVTVTGATGGATTTGVTATPASFAFGACSTLAITVAGSPTGTSESPTGAVTLYVNGLTLGSATVAGYGGTSNGTYSACSNGGTALGASGAYTLTGIYAGDSNYTTSTSAGLSLTVQGSTKAQTTTNLSVTSASTIALGTCALVQAIPAYVARPNDDLPTGTVTFFVSGSTSLGSAALTQVSGSSTATLNVCTTATDVINATGSYTITSTYGGDANYNASDSNAVTLIVD
jgi:hypothetical protein